VKVVFNTLVDNRVNVQMGGRRNGLGADDLVFANNIIQGGPKALSIDGPLKDPTWVGNIIWKTEGGAGDMPAGGFTSIDPGLVKDGHGVYRLAKGSPAIGAGVGPYAFVAVDLDGEPRTAVKLDVGADQFSADASSGRPMTEADVGPNAPEEKDRPLIGAPKAVEWPLKRPEP
jgi:poly(beta-D-mannuronate) lyase